MLGWLVRSSVGIASLTLLVRVPSSSGVDALISKCLAHSELPSPAPLELPSPAPSELPSPAPSELPFSAPSELVPRQLFEVAIQLHSGLGLGPVVALADMLQLGLVPPLGLRVCVHSWNVFVVACCRAVVRSPPFQEMVPH